MSAIRYVVDTSIIIQLLISETDSPRVETLFAGAILPADAIELWTLEFGLL